MTEALSSLVGELDAMPARERRRILRALTPAERTVIERALADARPAAPAVARDPVELLSPPFAASVRAARAGPAKGVTAAARGAVLAAVDRPDPAGAGKDRAAGRSLLGALGGLFASRGRT